MQAKIIQLLLNIHSDRTRFKAFRTRCAFLFELFFLSHKTFLLHLTSFLQNRNNFLVVQVF